MTGAKLKTDQNIVSLSFSPPLRWNCSTLFFSLARRDFVFSPSCFGSHPLHHPPHLPEERGCHSHTRGEEGGGVESFLANTREAVEGERRSVKEGRRGLEGWKENLRVGWGYLRVGLWVSLLLLPLRGSVSEEWTIF